MRLPSFVRGKRTGPDRRRYRPALECLEDRCLLSGGYAQVNLASDVPGLAPTTDPNLVNPWGITFSPTSPFWFADNGSGVSDLLDGRGQPVPVTVTLPGAAPSGGTPTGTAFNSGSGFVLSENGVSAPSRFLFANQDGSISGWSATVDPARALPVVDNSSSGADYTGLTLATDPAGHSFLYAADFSRGTVDVFDQDFRPVVPPGSFHDPNLPAGFAPFNIQNINNQLFVTYARQAEGGRDDVAGAGHGFIDVYDAGGSLVRRFASQGALNSPWGLALAPAGFGPFGGDLLVGNNGDGHINAYDPGNGNFLGQIADVNGNPIALPNLWALTFGNGHLGGDPNTLFFAAGVTYDQHGLFGAIQSPQRRGADTAGTGAFDPTAPGEVGDYPLPPSAGPLFGAGRADPLLPTADLLPLKESSLALIPTLSTVSQPGAGIESPDRAASGRDVFVHRSDTALLLPADGDSRPARADPSGAVALHTFLELNAPANVPPTKAGAPGPGTDLYAVGARSSPAADPNVEAEDPLAALPVERPETPASAEQGRAVLPPSGQADEVLTAVTPETLAEAADEGAVRNERVETRDGRRRLDPITLFLIASIPVLCTYWVRHQARAPQSAAGQEPAPPATPLPPSLPRDRLSAARRLRVLAECRQALR
jgi:uncharacterized protein (TIGR03118 family)